MIDVDLDLYQSQSKTLSYRDILEHLSICTAVYKNYVAQDYTDFILNVIAAIIHDVDIILVDYRNESDGISKNEVTITPVRFDSISELSSAIMASKSNVGILSSGTTGTPKLIDQTVNRLLKSVRVSEEYHNSRWGFTYNPSHSAGIQVFLQAICNEATLFDLYKCSRSEIIRTVDVNEITHLSATPTFYRMMAPYDFGFPSIKSLTFNGEKSTLSLINDVKSACPNARIRNIYGSTESGPLMSSETNTFVVPDRLKDQLVVDNDELLISGDLVSKSVNAKQWYRTGDLVRIVSDNPLTIEFMTRKSIVLNVGGQNVNPQEVEVVLISHPAVKDARVYGRPNKMIGNLVVAEVELLDNIAVIEKELISWCKENLASYKVPRMIKLVEKIKVGRTGKKCM